MVAVEDVFSTNLDFSTDAPGLCVGAQVIHTARPSAVDVPAMTHINHRHDADIIRYFIEHPVLANANAPPFSACQFLATGRARVIR